MTNENESAGSKMCPSCGSGIEDGECPDCLYVGPGVDR